MGIALMSPVVRSDENGSFSFHYAKWEALPLRKIVAGKNECLNDSQLALT